jgi:hypothetical protein
MHIPLRIQNAAGLPLGIPRPPMIANFGMNLPPRIPVAAQRGAIRGGAIRGGAAIRGAIRGGMPPVPQRFDATKPLAELGKPQELKGGYTILAQVFDPITLHAWLDEDIIKHSPELRQGSVLITNVVNNDDQTLKLKSREDADEFRKELLAIGCKEEDVKNFITVFDICQPREEDSQQLIALRASY